MIEVLLRRSAATASSILPASFRERLIELTAHLLKGNVVSYQDQIDTESGRSYPFGDDETFRYTEPALSGEIPTDIDGILGEQACKRPFVLEVPDAVLSTNQGLVIPRKGSYLQYDYGRRSDSDGSIGRKERIVARALVIGIRDGNLPNLTARIGDDLPTIDAALPLLGTHATNYTHWTQECLTLLEGLKTYERETGVRPTLLVPPDPPSFVLQSLDHFGHSNNVREWEFDQVRVRRLVLPSPGRCLNANGGGFVRKQSALRWVRRRAIERLQRDGQQAETTRVFISREDADTRRIVNREPVANRLRGMGFEKHVLSELTYREQVELFSSAELVVGTHGAGMVNTLYMDEGGVLELYGDHYLPANYEISQHIGTSYGCLRCESHGKDLFVDIDRLDAVLDQLRHG